MAPIASNRHNNGKSSETWRDLAWLVVCILEDTTIYIFKKMSWGEHIVLVNDMPLCTTFYCQMKGVGQETKIEQEVGNVGT